MHTVYTYVYIDSNIYGDRTWNHMGMNVECAFATPGRSDMSVNYCMPRPSWHLATLFKGLHELEPWKPICFANYNIVIFSSVKCVQLFICCLILISTEENIIPITLTTDNMFYSKTWVKNTALPWITDLVCKCTFEYSAVRLVRIKINYLFLIKFTIIGSNNKLSMNKSNGNL